MAAAVTKSADEGAEISRTWRELEDLAQSAYDAGELLEARDLLMQATADPGCGVSAWTNLGLVYFDLGDLRAATVAYSRGDWDSVGLHVNRGLAFDRLGAIAPAREEYEIALQLEPGNVNALVDLGTLEMNVGSLARARTLLERAAEIDPTVNWHLVDLFLEEEDLDAAAHAALAAIEAGEVRAYIDLAQIEARRHDWARSDAAYRAAIAHGVDGAAEHLEESRRDRG